MTKFLAVIHRFVWGAPTLLLILGVGVYLSLRTGFVQLRLLPGAMRTVIAGSRKRKAADHVISPFQALCTALAATVGTGNLVGVAGAICLGGPGAVFWMWISALLGMGTKFAEVTLALRYRERIDGEFVGGPMYIVRNGMPRKWRFLGSIYAFLGVIAAFGVGNTTQVNAIVTGMDSILSHLNIHPAPIYHLILGLLLAMLIGMLLLGGARRIGQAAQMLIPFLSAGYILLCITILFVQRSLLPNAFRNILLGAFSPRAATGGLLGSAFQALRVGCSRGVFTNEAGMGTGSIAHASATVCHPAQQGLMGILEVFLDTIVICTMTALVLLVSGVPIPYGTDLGGELTLTAFRSVLGNWADLFLAISLCCFAFATILGWSLYGARCGQYLFGKSAWKPFVLIQCLVTLFSAQMNTQAVWLFSEIMNALMAIPNLITLAILSPEFFRLTIEYERNQASVTPLEVPYANIHQC